MFSMAGNVRVRTILPIAVLTGDKTPVKNYK